MFHGLLILGKYGWKYKRLLWDMTSSIILTSIMYVILSFVNVFYANQLQLQVSGNGHLKCKSSFDI